MDYKENGINLIEFLSCYLKNAIRITRQTFECIYVVKRIFTTLQS